MFNRERYAFIYRMKFAMMLLNEFQSGKETGTVGDLDIEPGPGIEL
jgi:hypothetical protein